ncbi:RNA polymerase sigma factor [Enterococcus sp. HY326]|uniref:RNA polymerase sigma factor n=1 Tax=Enterococcus sp. HY326 TaxID=2971265 RepID=UPI00223F2698|nr:sigma-70 family RNA polymerase sigma factor [Enterococcus sp. HY326]
MLKEEMAATKEVELAALIQEYSKLLYAVALSILGRHASKEDVEELVSDVFLRYWQNQSNYNPKKGSLKNYLALLTKSMSLNKLKQNKRLFEKITDFPLEDLPEAEKENADIWDIFFEALLLIDEPTKEICLQRFFYELKPKVIAENMGMDLKEVKNRLYQGKKKIRKEMEFLLLAQGGLHK